MPRSATRRLPLRPRPPTGRALSDAEETFALLVAMRGSEARLSEIFEFAFPADAANLSTAKKAAAGRSKRSDPDIERKITEIARRAFGFE